MATAATLLEMAADFGRQAQESRRTGSFNLALAMFGLFALVLAPTPARADLPTVSVVHETRVTLEVQLSLLQVFGSGRAIDLKETLKGLAGERLTLARTIDTPGGPLRVLLGFTPDPDERSSQCLVRVVSDVRRDAAAARMDRTVVVRPGRSAIVELWSAPDGRNRLVLTLAARWADVPLVVAGVAGAQAIEFLVEPVIEYEGQLHPRPERRLAGIVGAPIRYSVHHRPAVDRPGESPTAEPKTTTEGTEEEAFPPDQEAEVLIELLPAAIDGGDVDLSVRVTVEVQPPAAADAPPPPRTRRDTISRRKVAAGETFELSIPLERPGPTMVLRVTPFF